MTPLPILDRSFDVADEGKLSWYTAAFILTVDTFILPGGRLGDVHRHRTICLIAYAWYAVWSVIVGVAVYSVDILSNIPRGM